MHFEPTHGSIETARIVLIGVPASNAKALALELQSLPVEVVSVSDLADSLQHLSDPRSVASIAWDSGMKDCLAFIGAAKRISKVRWILFSKDQTTRFRSKAVVEHGIDMILDYPFITSKFLGRLITILQEYYKTQNIREKGDFKTIEANKDFRNRRQWPDLSEKAIDNVVSDSISLKNELKKSLCSVIHDIQDLGRLSLISLGVESPIIMKPPERFVILTSSADNQYENLFLNTNRYPELLKAVESQRPILVNNIAHSPHFTHWQNVIAKTPTKAVAAIPLFRGTQVFALLKMRFHDNMKYQPGELMRDLTAYAADITPHALKIDFMTRVYRSMQRTKSEEDFKKAA